MKQSSRMTPDEARAVIRLWSRRQWEREHWPTVADIAEGLGIESEEAAALLREVRGAAGAGMGTRAACAPTPWRAGARPAFFPLAAGMIGLTAFFCLFLERLLA